MDGNELKQKIKVWAATKEYRAAVLALMSAGLSPSLAEMLVKGTYVSTPKGRTIDILRKVLADDTKAS